MKLMGALLVLTMLAFGFFCVFAACAGGWELAHTTVTSMGETICLWFMVVLTLLSGMMCFACCPLIVNEM